MNKNKAVLIVAFIGFLFGLLLVIVRFHFLSHYLSDENSIKKEFYNQKVINKEIFLIYYSDENISHRNHILYLCSTKKIDKFPLLKVDCSERNKND